MYTYYKGIHIKNLGDYKDKITGILLIFILLTFFPNPHS